jgi:hypothetical protein
MIFLLAGDSHKNAEVPDKFRRGRRDREGRGAARFHRTFSSLQ